MASFLRLRPSARPARFRSTERDEATDQLRLDGIRAAIRHVIASVEREDEGLRRRIADAAGRASGLAGTEDGQGLAREAADEALLAEAERQLLAASARLADLREQHDLFIHLLGLVGESGESIQRVKARLSGAHLRA
jgi:hypothetical protein